jgi:hypothetical protein
MVLGQLAGMPSVLMTARKEKELLKKMERSVAAESL